MTESLTDNSTLLAETYTGKVKYARCDICGIEGEYGKDIVDTGTIDTAGHDTVKPMCRDIRGCLKRLEDTICRR
jgi:hypothetical protein